jgi:hypothetical protein
MSGRRTVLAVPTRGRRGLALALALFAAQSLLLGLASCGTAPTVYGLRPALRPSSTRYTLGAAPASAPAPEGNPGPGSSPDVTGSLSVEATQSGQNLVVVQLAELPPPERLGSGLTEFVVWLEDEHGHRVKAGVLRYDRARHSGNLLATTDLSAFTVQVTGERSQDVSSPSDVLVVERKVSPN